MIVMTKQRQEELRTWLREQREQEEADLEQRLREALAYVEHLTETATLHDPTKEVEVIIWG